MGEITGCNYSYFVELTGASMKNHDCLLVKQRLEWIVDRIRIFFVN